MKKIIAFLFIIGLITNLNATNNPSQWPTLIGPKGEIQPNPLTKEHENTITFLKGEIKGFEDKISANIPYLKSAGKIKEGVFNKDTLSGNESIPGSKHDYIINESFKIKVDSSDKIESITFYKRAGRMGLKYEENTVVRELSGKPGDEKSIQMKVETNTNYTTLKSPITQVFSFESIPNPDEKIRLMRFYRTKLELACRSIDRLIEAKVTKDYNNTINTIQELGSQPKE